MDIDSFIPALYKPSVFLPILQHKRQLQYTVEKWPVTILIGATGSGKTTQVPQYLLEAGWCNDGKVIAVTQASEQSVEDTAFDGMLTVESQPRRVAACTVAKRIADEMGCQLGQEVGYTIRFEDVTSTATKIKIMTDGMLLREALVDPLLSRYSVIMVDEAHERSLSSDLLLAILKKILKKRSDLRVVISSATMQPEEFRKFFADEKMGPDGKLRANNDQVRVALLEGRAHSVDILNLEQPCENFLKQAIQVVFDIHTSEPPGDILVFLTGRQDIETALEMVADRLPTLPEGSDKILPLPLYAGLQLEQQMHIFEVTPDATRKVIFSTNIAEASVTIDGIANVIDCGFVKLRVFDPATGIDKLITTPISKASANQRAGRAGRTQPGKCYRLYPESSYNTLEATTVPEIQRSNLAPMILQLKALGVDNVMRFDYFAPPHSTYMIRALDLLYAIGALDDNAKLTQPLGARMAELAIDPMLAKCLLSSPSFGCLSEVLSIAALVSVQSSVWSGDGDGGFGYGEDSPRFRFAVEEGDHLTMLNVHRSFSLEGKGEARWCQDNDINFKTMTQVSSVRNQLRRYLERFGIDVTETDVTPTAKTSPEESIRRCLTAGYFAHAARMMPDGTFRTTDGAKVLHAHPSSLFFKEKVDWVIFTEVVQTGQKTFIRDMTKIEKSWLTEYAPDFYRERE